MHPSRPRSPPHAYAAKGERRGLANDQKVDCEIPLSAARSTCEPMLPSDSTPDWKHHGVRVVKASQLDTNTPQTPGMDRAAAINRALAGAEKLWAGTVTIHPNAK